MRPWIKTHTNRLNDLRFADLSGNDEQAYDRLYILAGQVDADGLFIERDRPLTIEEIAYRVRLPLQQLSKSIKVLERRKLLRVNGKGPQIIDWDHQQTDMNKVREQTRERVQRYRENVTDRNALQDDVTPIEPDQNQNQNQSQTQRRTNLPPIPSSRNKKNMAGGMDGNKSESDEGPRAAKTLSKGPKTLSKGQRARKHKVMKILAAFGITNPKIETLSNKLAIRIYKSDDHLIAHVLAGIASAIADERVKNKEGITIYRLEQDSIPPRFEDPREWKVIPAAVLAAAGIDDLDRYISRQSMKKYLGDDDE